MPRHRLASLALIVLAAFAAFHLTGCTAIGFGVGAMVDVSAGKGPANRLETVPTGKHVTLWLRDGGKLHGRFLGSRDSLGDASSPERPVREDAFAAPLRAVLVLGTHDGTQQVATRDVIRVSVPAARGKVIGLLGGLAADVVLGLVLFAAVSTIAGV